MRQLTLNPSTGSRIVRAVFTVTALFGWLVMSPQVKSAQSPLTLTVTDPSGHVLITEPATYLGRGVIAGSWKAATLQGIYQSQSPAIFESPRHRLGHYLMPAPDSMIDSRMVAVEYALCNGQWQLSTPGNIDEADCLPFDLTPLITLQTDSFVVRIKRLLYADQQADVALWEVADPVPADWSPVPLANTIGNALTYGGQWVNDLYGQVIERGDTPLPSILGEAHLSPVTGGASIGDPTTPELGNTGYSVTHYDLALNFDADQGTLQGVATLTTRITYPQLARFSLDFSVLTAQKVTIDGQIAAFQQDAAVHKLYIVPTNPLDYGKTISIQVTYGGLLRTFNSRYINFLPIGMFVDTATKHIFDVDEPDGANSWFPCNDHPLDRSTFTFHITVNDNLYAAANGTLQGDPIQNADGTRTFTWDMPQPMATYLAVIAIADYDPRSLADTQGHIPLTVYAYAKDADAAQQIFQVSDPLMKLEIARFGPFPFDHYGQVLVEQQNVGMESQTLTVLPDGIVRSSQQSIVTFVGHEMAHQWYGDSVGLSSWGEIWLNEGFASYAEYLDQADSGNMAQAANLLNRWKADVRSLGHKESLQSIQPTDMFGINSYEKGGYVLHMLREQIGDAAFFKTMQTYAQAFKNRNATSDDFWSIAEDVSGQDLSQFFTQWVTWSTLPTPTILWTKQALPGGGSVIDALICQSKSNPFTIDLPITLSAAVPVGTATQSATVMPPSHDEVLHISSAQLSVHFTEPIDVQTWQIDRANTVLNDAAAKYVNGALPATCPAS